MVTTEIYICREGQSLEEGRVEYSDLITSREDAESDAQRRCATHAWIKKIAYYSITDSGEFRIFYSYTNPNAVSVAKSKKPPASVRKPRTKPVKKKKPMSFWQRLAFWKTGRR